MHKNDEMARRMLAIDEDSSSEDSRVKLSLSLALLATGFAAAAARAAAPVQPVPMYDKGLSTYYVAGHIDDYGAVEFMVDTGSAYVILMEDTLKALKARGDARYLRELSGIMADGSRMTVPVFLIRGLRIGAHCELHDVEATVIPSASRNVLGLSALRKAAPFTVSLNPPSLALSGCSARETTGNKF